MKKTNDKGMPGQNQVGKAAQACEESILALFICYTHHQMGKYGRCLLAQTNT